MAPVVAPRVVSAPAIYPTIIFIAGIQATTLVRVRNLTITDVLNEQPNTAALTVNLLPHVLPSPPFHPPSFDNVAFNTTPSPSIYPDVRRGQPIEIYSGGLSPDQLVFGGEIVSVQQIYEADVPKHVALHLSCIDYTRALNRRKVTKSYLTQSVTAIVLDLMASRLADGFTTTFVQANLPPIAIDFTFEDMNRALTRLANRIGAYWYIDYSKALHFFTDEPAEPPAPLVPGERFDDLRFETDLSQVRTRVVVEGAGSVVSTQIAVGETMIPVRDPVMFQPAGGLAIIGQQRISYTGVQTGDQGALVGPGAQPGAAPVATAIVGAGIEVGTHNYAVTYVSASGESLPSPMASVVLGKTDPPPTAPTPNPPTAGTGPDPGVHEYAVSFVTANGETTPSPTNSITTTQVGGVAAPGVTNAVLRNVVGNLAGGSSFRYKTTVTTAAGETIPGAVGNTITTLPPTAPGNFTTQMPTTLYQPGSGLLEGQYLYNAAYVSGAYETALGSQLNVIASSPIPQVPPNPLASLYAINTATGGSIGPGNYYYGIAYVYGAYESAIENVLGQNYITVGPTTNAVAMTLNGFSDPRCTGIKIYRTKANVYTAYYLAATLSPSSTYQNYTDTKADAALGAMRPDNNPIGTPPALGVAIKFLSFVPSTNPKVTGIRLYRWVPNSAAWRVVTTLANAETAYTDAAADGALGAARATSGPIGTPPGDQATVTIPTSGDARAVGRKVYRSDNSAPFRFLATIANNTATQYIDNIASVSSNADAPTTDTTGGAQTCVVALTNIPLGPGAVTARRLYRTPANSTQLLLLATISNNTATTYSDNKNDSTLGAAPPATNTTDTRQVALSKIPVGSSGVTARKVYRTAANAAQLKLLGTVADNTTTGFTDNNADATLGANVPTVDTSNLQQPQGQVNAGATVMPVSATAGFAAAGGFAVVGNGEQVIRYSGITATTLTGIPASGPGSLTATVPYNSSVTNAPALIGVPAAGPGAIAARGLVDGEEIHLLIERNDTAAQAELAAIEGGDGVIEHYIQDRRLSAAGATTTADAELALFSRAEVRVTYTTRDTKTRTGKTIVANLPSPTNLVGEFLIQRVQLTQFDIPGVPPLRTVAASSTRFSFDDVLRRLELEVYA